MHRTESRFVKGPSNILFVRVYVCTFQPGNFTGWGSEGVNSLFQPAPLFSSSDFVFCDPFVSLSVLPYQVMSEGRGGLRFADVPWVEFMYRVFILACRAILPYAVWFFVVVFISGFSSVK